MSTTVDRFYGTIDSRIWPRPGFGSRCAFSAHPACHNVRHPRANSRMSHTGQSILGQTTDLPIVAQEVPGKSNHPGTVQGTGSFAGISLVFPAEAAGPAGVWRSALPSSGAKEIATEVRRASTNRSEL